MDWRERIVVDPAVCHGKACVKGSRVMASVVLDNLAAGEKEEEIARAYRISVDDAKAALAYAADLARERVVALPVGGGVGHSRSLSEYPSVPRSGRLNGHT
jgi:uncharacterized protein (DUF433 family)